MAATHEPAEELDEPVYLSDWDPAWPVRAKALAEDLTSIIGRDKRIEHIGSTAVEGMRAKPVVDLMVGAADEEELEDIARKLVGMGWTDMGEAGVPGRRHLRRRSGEHANLHIVLFRSLHWVNNLTVRDFLRAHPNEQRLYATLKETSVASGADRLLAYSDRKAPFMAALLERGTRWRKIEHNDR
jgi:GrpB-like predicted nucleotidyltransferase (UPF0157 family)